MAKFFSAPSAFSAVNSVYLFFSLIFVRKIVIICTKYGGNDFRLEREASGDPHVFVSADTRQNPFSGRKAKVLNLGHLYFDIVSTVRCPVEVLELRISYFSYRDTLHASRDTSLPSTFVENPLQINPFMQNKANFCKSQVNVTPIVIIDYENRTLSGHGKNKANSKPIQTQFKANQTQLPKEVKLMHSVYLQRIMKKNAAKGYEKTKPKQTQFPKSQKMNANAFSQKDYENEIVFRLQKNKPKQSQFQT